MIKNKIEPSIDTLNIIFKIIEKIIGNDNIKTILEFGSRYGEDSVCFAKKYPSATIYSFECNPNILNDCVKNTSVYKNIILTQKAISDKNEIVPFYVNDPQKTQTTWIDGNQGASSLFKSSGKYPVEQYVQNRVNVETIRLDGFIKQNNITNVDLIWMDIQGAELKALKGLGNKINTVKIIHLEVEFFKIYKSQPLFKHIIKYLTKNNFTFTGYTSVNKYSGDAVFINNVFFNQREVISVKNIVTQGLDLQREPKDIRLSENSLIYKLIFKILMLIKKINNIEPSFNVYIPNLDSSNLQKWYYKVFKTLFKLNVQCVSVKSDIPIDVLIPLVEKDLHLVGSVVDSARKYVMHDIGNIYIVAPDQENIKELVKTLDCVYINENKLSVVSKEDINYTVNGVDRRGWLFQQLIKLSADKICVNDNVLVIDADTILNKPHIFIKDNKYIFNYSDEFHFPYYEAFYRLFGIKSKSNMSFVSHYMIFNKKYLSDLKSYIERHTSLRWDYAILNNLVKEDPSGFSEYETYGNFMFLKHADKMILEYWFNLSLTQHQLVIPPYIKSLSYHSYNQ